MAPRTVDGAPVGGATVIIPVRFSGGRPVPPGARITVASGLAWGAAPTAAELAEAFPKDAAGHAAKAHVVLRCQVDSSGGLRDCSIMTEQPSGLGFGRAARALSKRFRIFDDPDYANTVKGDYVDIPFDFHDPAQQQPPLEVLDPTWLQTVDPVKASQLFPEAAAKAGLTTGRATLVCQVAHDGSLTACTVAEELPSGLGFGEAALAIAAVMKMNPWTQQGFPVDGAKIRLPIRVNLMKTDPSATATKP
jgi:Gram-negative bacterial TonB protein C-terminal